MNSTAPKHIFAGSALGFGNRVKAQVIEKGRVVFETPWANNLLLDQGMDKINNTKICDLFLFAVAGTGNTPTEDDSGAITASTVGTTCTASAPIFAGGDVGKLLRFDTGEKAYITAFTSNLIVTLSATLGVTTQQFSMHRVAQTGLATETKRTNSYVSGSSNCFSSRSGSTITHQRTYDFTVEVGSVNYAEIGFSHTVTVASNLNSRALFAGGAVTVLAGQNLRVIYQFLVTLSPTTPFDKTPTITGWPSLQQAVTCDNTTDLITLSTHGFTLDMPLTFQGSVAPTGLTFGTTYYARDISTNTFGVAASPGGAAINFTTNGTSVVVITNLIGQEVCELVGLTSITSAGATSTFEAPSGANTAGNEPGGNTTFYITLSTDTAALQSFPGTAAVVPNVAGSPGHHAMVDASYTNGSFTRTKTATFSTSEGNSSAIRKLYVSSSLNGGVTGNQGGPCFRFNQKQEKDNSHTLAITWRWTWDRLFT